MENIFELLKNKLIVSCQAEGSDPFNMPEYLLLFARAAIMGGASGIRTQGRDNTAMIAANVNVPVIGLIKSDFEDGFVRITGSFKDVEDLISAGSHMIAIDGTFRKREGLSGPQFIEQVKKRYNCLIMADIAELDEGLACADSGADCVSSTLSGYTPSTINKPKDLPDYKLVESMAGTLKVPVIAEGKINRPEFARIMLEHGAWSVVVGTVITRPRVVTSWFADEMKKAQFNI